MAATIRSARASNTSGSGWPKNRPPRYLAAARDDRGREITAHRQVPFRHAEMRIVLAEPRVLGDVGRADDAFAAETSVRTPRYFSASGISRMPPAARPKAYRACRTRPSASTTCGRTSRTPRRTIAWRCRSPPGPRVSRSSSAATAVPTRLSSSKDLAFLPAAVAPSRVGSARGGDWFRRAPSARAPRTAWSGSRRRRRRNPSTLASSPARADSRITGMSFSVVIGAHAPPAGRNRRASAS